MNLFQRTAAVFNRGVIPLLNVPGIGPLLGRSTTVLTYRGRRSGAEFRLPVSYRRKGNDVLVGVALPDRKNWWRNFTGDGGPIGLTLDGRPRTGHAVATQNEKGDVGVRITLDS